MCVCVWGHIGEWSLSWHFARHIASCNDLWPQLPRLSSKMYDSKDSGVLSPLTKVPVLYLPWYMHLYLCILSSHATCPFLLLWKGWQCKQCSWGILGTAPSSSSQGEMLLLGDLNWGPRNSYVY